MAALLAAPLAIHTCPDDRPSIPDWFAELILLARHFAQRGVLDSISEQVRLARGRAGQYEVLDFVALLLGYAVSGSYLAANAAGGTLRRPCLVLLDEAGNVAPLVDLPAYAATARSHGISFVTVWQDLSQIDSIYGEWAATVLNNRGYSSYLAGNFEAAERDFRSALSADPGYEKAWQNLGLVYARRGEYRTAVATLTRVVEDHVAANDVGYIAMLSGDYPTAERLFAEAIRLSPRYYQAANENVAELRRRRATTLTVQ